MDVSATPRKLEDGQVEARDSSVATVLAEARALAARPDRDAVATLHARFDARLLRAARVHHVAMLRLDPVFDADGIKVARLLLRTADAEQSAA